MSRAAAELLENVDAIYDTVLDASRWPDVLDRTAATAGAYGTILMVRDPVIRDLQIHVTSSRIASHDAAAYVATQLSDDEMRWDQALDQEPALTVLHDTNIWPDRAAYDAMPSVQWLRGFDLGHRSAVRLCAHGGWRDTIAAVYPEARGGMTAREARRLAPLLPHLARATEIRRPFALLKSRYHAILKMLDHLGIGVLVLLDDDHILLENAEVQRILDAGDGFRRRADGRLAIPSADAGELQPTLSQVLAELRAGTRQDGATVYLRRRREAEPYVIDVTAFRESGAELGSPVSGALLLVIDPERRSVISTRGLARVYGLTDAEAAVCELLGAGHSTREIADIRGVSIETVKAQSKAILRKTLCANRIELVRRALSIAPPLLDDRGRRED